MYFNSQAFPRAFKSLILDSVSFHILRFQCHSMPTSLLENKYFSLFSQILFEYYILRIFSFFFRLIVLGVTLKILEWDRSIYCIFLLWKYFIGYLVIFTSCVAVEVSICLVATRGSILDTTTRASMQYLLYIRLCKLAICFTYIQK